MILSELKADGKWQWLLMQAFLMIMKFSSRWKASNLLSRSGEKQFATPTAITDLKSIYGDVTITSFGVTVHQGTCVTITHRTLTQDMLLLIKMPVNINVLYILFYYLNI